MEYLLALLQLAPDRTVTGYLYPASDAETPLKVFPDEAACQAFGQAVADGDGVPWQVVCVPIDTDEPTPS